MGSFRRARRSIPPLSRYAARGFVLRGCGRRPNLATCGRSRKPPSISKPRDRRPWVEPAISYASSGTAGSGPGDDQPFLPSLRPAGPLGPNGCGSRESDRSPVGTPPAGPVGVCGLMAAGQHYPLDTRGSTEARSRSLGRDGRLVSST